MLTPDEVYQKALTLTLAHEGDYSNHPLDPGKATMRGVTQATYDAWRKSQGWDDPKSVADIAEFELYAIYRSYWDYIEGDTLEPALALQAFDIAVNNGKSNAARWLAEGYGATPEKLYARRMRHYVALSIWETFGKGWARRATDVLAAAQELEVMT